MGYENSPASLRGWDVIRPEPRTDGLPAAREVEMPKFVIEREIPGLGNMSDTEIREVSRKSVSILREMGPEIQWLQSYVTGDKLYCVYLAPDEATVREHARRGGFPANRVSAVRRMIDPTTAEA
jgi:Protein of unknown function (DUF4242)